MKHFFIILAIAIGAQMAFSQSLAQSPGSNAGLIDSADRSLHALEGFFNLSERFDVATVSQLKKSVFKLFLDKNYEHPDAAHGTAFGIRRDGFLMTNAHNLAGCLRRHSLESVGYAGQRGELACQDLVIVDARGQAYHEVSLVASNPLVDSEGRDFAVIRVSNLGNEVLKFSSGPFIAKQSIVGFPSQTRRDFQNLSNTIAEINKAIGQTQQFVDQVESYRGRSMAHLYDLQAAHFHRLVILVRAAANSSFLATAVDDQKFSFSDFSSLSVAEYKKKIRDWSAEVISRLNTLSVTLEKGLAARKLDTKGFRYPNADSNLKTSSAVMVKSGQVKGYKVLVLKADAMPGTSGSPVVDKKGFISAVVYSVHGTEDSKGCSKEALDTGFESIKYVYCKELNFFAVPASEILSQLKSWGI